MVDGRWPVACGLWPVACGLWPVACGLWPVAWPDDRVASQVNK